MNVLGIEINEDGKTIWRNNGGVIERKALYAEKPKWETVGEGRDTPHTPDELRAICEAGGFGYECPDEYAIAIVRNYFQPDIQRKGDPDFLRNDDDVPEPVIYATYDEALAALDNLDSEPYVTSSGEAGRPDAWIVDARAVWDIEAQHEDLGLYDWPDDCTDWDCCDEIGNVCGQCMQCLDLIASQDLQIIRGYAVN